MQADETPFVRPERIRTEESREAAARATLVRLPGEVLQVQLG
jgi:hypothetical protein